MIYIVYLGQLPISSIWISHCLLNPISTFIARNHRYEKLLHAEVGIMWKSSVVTMHSHSILAER